MDLKKEQKNTKLVSSAESRLGQRAHNTLSKKWINVQNRTQIIVLEDKEYKHNNDQLAFLQIIAHNIVVT